MEENESSTRRIAKNTIALYIRMFLSMIVGLYTSRVVLNTLGVEDYGIYGVVGGVVAMLGFLNASMSGATSRFITFELGRKNYSRLKDTFSSAMIIHIGIALVVIIVAETVGLWFLNNKLVIPPGRMDAAHWVYQCSILSAALGITQVPYNATIIAHERMGVYAYIEIINVTLKLLIVYLLTIGNFDKLKLYAVLVLAVSFIVMMIYRIYCIRNFSESRFHWIWNKEIIRPMLSFSGWDLYGNMCVTVRQQGTNFLINIFFGTVANAATALTSTASNIIMGLAQNINVAFKPQIIKNYANSDFPTFQYITNCAIKFSSALYIMLAIPTFLEMEMIISIWLGKIPTYVVPFCRITIVSSLLILNDLTLKNCIQATGYVKLINILNGLLLLLAIPLSYIFLKLGYNATTPYIIQFGILILIIVTNICILKYQIKEFKFKDIFKYYLRLIFIALLIVSSCSFLYNIITTSFIRIVILYLCSGIEMTFLSYLLILNTNERILLKKYLYCKICSRC